MPQVKHTMLQLCFSYTDLLRSEHPLHRIDIFVAMFLAIGYNQYWPSEFMVYVFFVCPGTPEGSTGNGSGFKSSQKTGPWLKVSSVLSFFCSVYTKNSIKIKGA